MIIQSPHPDFNEPKTYLTATAAAAATSLTVANNGQFSANDYIVVGKAGEEGAELKQVSTVSGNTTINIASSALKFGQSANTPVTYIKYNQVKFYLGDWSARYSTGTIAANKGSAVITGTGTSWGSITTAYALLLNGKWYDIKSVDSATQITLTEIYNDEDIISATYALVQFTAQATVDIAIDQDATLWDDTDALVEDYYRTEYYNSTSTLVSTKSSIISAAEEEGFSEFSQQAIIDQVLSDLRDPEGKRRSRDEVARDINDCLRDLTNTIVSKVQEDYLSSFETIDFRANEYEYPLFDDFRKLTSVWISYDGTNYEPASRMEIKDDSPSHRYSESAPFIYLRDNVLGVKPTPTAAVTSGAKVWYERRVPSLVHAGDLIPHILRDFKRLFVDYCLSVALAADDKPKSLGYKGDYTNGKKDMVEALKDRDRGQNDKIEITQDQDLYDD